jgi:hypothetical protein
MAGTALRSYPVEKEKKAEEKRDFTEGEEERRMFCGYNLI